MTQQQNTALTVKEEAFIVPTEKRDRTNPEYWKEVARYWKKKFEDEKYDRQIAEQDSVAIKGMLEEYTVAYNGMDRKRQEAKKLATQEVNSDYAACTEIDDVVKGKKTPFNFKLTIAAAALIGFLVFVWQYGSNPTFKSGIDANFPMIAIIVIAIAFIAFILYSKKK